MKKKLIYQSPAILQQAEVLLELALLENSGHETQEVIQNSEIKAGSSDYGVTQTYGQGAWLD